MAKKRWKEGNALQVVNAEAGFSIDKNHIIKSATKSVKSIRTYTAIRDLCKYYGYKVEQVKKQ